MSRAGARAIERSSMTDPRARAQAAFVAAAAAAFGLRRPPELRVAPTAALQATASPDGDGVVALSDGLLRAASPPVVQAILAHELAHLSFGDQRWAARARGLAALTYGLAALGVPSILFGAAATGEGMRLVSGGAALGAAVVAAAAISGALGRWREFAADRAAITVVEPAALATALALFDDHERLARRRLGALRWAAQRDPFRPTPRRRLAALRRRT